MKNGDFGECKIPPTPSMIELENIGESTEEKELVEKLKEYGITEEEWKQIEEYKGAKYFILTTALHNINIFDLRYPPYSKFLSEIDYLDPKILADSYCKIYSAICKFSKKNNNNTVGVKRISSELYKNEMKKTGETASFISFSKDKIKHAFHQNREKELILKGIIKKGTPYIDLTKILSKDKEKEIIVPPFVKIEYFDSKDKIDSSKIEISYKKQEELGFEINEDFIKTVLDSKVLRKYYENWYQIIKSNPRSKGEDKKSKELTEEFNQWQKKFKNYLRYRFREIEKEVHFEDQKANNFLEQIITESKEIGTISGIINTIKKIKEYFKEKVKNLEERN